MLHAAVAICKPPTALAGSQQICGSTSATIVVGDSHVAVVVAFLSRSGKGQNIRVLQNYLPFPFSEIGAHQLIDRAQVYSTMSFKRADPRRSL